jgi:hypothetical protein
MIIPVAHDFSCPWCWIGLHQAKRLAAEFGVEFNWLAYEIYPETMDFEPKPRIQISNRPPPPPPLPRAYKQITAHHTPPYILLGLLVV